MLKKVWKRKVLDLLRGAFKQGKMLKKQQTLITEEREGDEANLITICLSNISIAQTYF